MKTRPKSITSLYAAVREVLSESKLRCHRCGGGLKPCAQMFMPFERDSESDLMSFDFPEVDLQLQCKACGAMRQMTKSVERKVKARLATWTDE